MGSLSNPSGLHQKGEFSKGLVKVTMPPSPRSVPFTRSAFRILRQHARALGYPKKFSIYDRGDQESLARTVLRELRLPGTALRPSDMLAIISGWKNESVLPDRAVNLAGTDREHFAAAAYRRYQNALKLRGAMDFDDLLLQTEQLFRNNIPISGMRRHRSTITFWWMSTKTPTVVSIELLVT